MWAAMSTHMELVLQAAAFAAEKHRLLKRKDAEASPYINHPIQVAYILVQADVEDPIVLAAALLHDTIEDTKTTHDEIEIVFGHEIANIVTECSDDKSLDKLDRKQAQVDKAAHVSTRAKLVQACSGAAISRAALKKRIDFSSSPATGSRLHASWYPKRTRAESSGDDCRIRRASRCACSSTKGLFIR